MEFDHRLRECVENELIGLCITPDYRGYRYLCMAIELTMEHEELLYRITTSLYGEIARETGTTAANVERGIRTAITVMWNEADAAKLREVMGRTYHTPPSNAKFIGIMSRRILYKYAVELQRPLNKDV